MFPCSLIDCENKVGGGNACCARTSHEQKKSQRFKRVLVARVLTYVCILLCKIIRHILHLDIFKSIREIMSLLVFL